MSTITMNTGTFSVRMDKTKIERLEALAESTGRSRSFLTGEAVDNYLDVQEWQVAGIKQAMRSIDENGGIAHEEVGKWIKSWGKKSELPKPQPKAV